MVALHRAGISLTDGNTGHIHLLSRFEDIHLDIASSGNIVTLIALEPEFP
jgi:hypothetical protein